MNKILLTLSALFLLSLSAACGEVSCDDADCADGEVCVFIGSDVEGESASTQCRAFPGECSVLDCSCLNRTIDEDDGLRFCLDIAADSCRDDGAQVVVTCPGG